MKIIEKLKGIFTKRRIPSPRYLSGNCNTCRYAEPERECALYDSPTLPPDCSCSGYEPNSICLMDKGRKITLYGYSIVDQEGADENSTQVSVSMNFILESRK